MNFLSGLDGMSGSGGGCGCGGVPDHSPHGPHPSPPSLQGLGNTNEGPSGLGAALMIPFLIVLTLVVFKPGSDGK